MIDRYKVIARVHNRHATYHIWDETTRSELVGRYDTYQAAQDRINTLTTHSREQL